MKLFFIISAFIQLAFVHSMESNEVIVERGTNTYTANLHHSGKMTQEPANLLTVIKRKVESFIGFKLSLPSIGFRLAGRSGAET